MKKAVIAILILLAILIVGTLMNSRTTSKPVVVKSTQTSNISNTNNTSPRPGIACTMEARACSDGSYVSRTGPNCEFAACPENKVPKSTRTNVNKKIDTNGVIITPLRVTEDSRCPLGVSCMWAGTVKLQTRLEIGVNTEEVTLTLSTPVVFMGKNITLVNVMPNADSNKPTAEKDYIFTFLVK